MSDRKDHAASFEGEVRYYFQERAAIFEYDAKMSRDEAERRAYFATCATFRLVPSEPQETQGILFPRVQRGGRVSGGIP